MGDKVTTPPLKLFCRIWAGPVPVTDRATAPGLCDNLRLVEVVSEYNTFV